MNKTTDTVNNVTRFKEILLELHRGAKPASLYEQFHEVIDSASDEEYEEIKQQMIVEGIPGKKAKKWRRNIIKSKQQSMEIN